MTVNARKHRQWDARAKTILRKAEDLFCDMMGNLPVEHPLTDKADNLTDTTEELIYALKQWKP